MDTEAETVCYEAYQLVGALTEHIENADKWLDNLSEARLVHKDLLPVRCRKDIAEKLAQGWFLVPPEPTTEMIQAYLFERSKGQYPHEDAGGGVARKIKALLTGKRQSQEQRTYHQVIDALMGGKK